ncbi:hypothetical protein MUN88_05610 [Gracilibacillus caseinilyticus]|uniref:Uncharacterized protein n=1 Tax=Gracilibacillus caseinilyticus TaxID=2932256 RepID=A0ABY4EZ45_9BACI|nr:hypothetical protein [Gracilibacillus caseinilyticus]UOQ49560.1 hypothetical protein MUN88_05610 [Gracilibacillus caseinilyticus]
MEPILLTLVTLFIVYRCIIYSLENFQEGNKTGGIAIMFIIPFVICFSIFFQIMK